MNKEQENEFYRIVECMVCGNLETECKCRDDNNEYPYGEVKE